MAGGKRPPLVSDLQAPPLGAPPAPRPASSPGGTVLMDEISLGELVDSRPPKSPPQLQAHPTERDARTIMVDAQSASIARAVSNSLLGTAERPQIAIPEALERGEIRKVLRGRPDAGSGGASPPAAGPRVDRGRPDAGSGGASPPAARPRVDRGRPDAGSGGASPPAAGPRVDRGPEDPGEPPTEPPEAPAPAPALTPVPAELIFAREVPPPVQEPFAEEKLDLAISPREARARTVPPRAHSYGPPPAPEVQEGLSPVLYVLFGAAIAVIVALAILVFT